MRKRRSARPGRTGKGRLGATRMKARKSRGPGLRPFRNSAYMEKLKAFPVVRHGQDLRAFNHVQIQDVLLAEPAGVDEVHVRVEPLYPLLLPLLGVRLMLAGDDMENAAALIDRHVAGENDVHAGMNRGRPAREQSAHKNMLVPCAEIY